MWGGVEARERTLEGEGKGVRGCQGENLEVGGAGKESQQGELGPCGE